MDLRARRDVILQRAASDGLFADDGGGLAAFLDLDAIEANVIALRAAFPSDLDVLHAFAVKAGPLVRVLDLLRNQGMGAEVASRGELALALDAKIDPARIVFDSPAKTRTDLQSALRLGVAVNADSWAELDRIDDLLAEEPSDSVLGVRINPEVGVGSIEAMSTAGSGSKFGVPVRSPDRWRALADRVARTPRITRLHAHVGSQGCPLELIGAGVAQLIDLADEIARRAGHPQITSLDIGGGLPVDFLTESFPSRFDAYTAMLAEHAPRALSGEFAIVTEFGRSILAKHGFTAARVEYVKESGLRPVAVTHAGVQVAARTVFMPEAWPLRLEARDSRGRLKDTPVATQDVAGPACFSGDVVGRGVRLPTIAEGDIVVLLDTGAYYASSHFDYNSLLAPPIYGARIRDHGVELSLVRAEATVEDLLARSGGTGGAGGTSGLPARKFCRHDATSSPRHGRIPGW